MTRFGSVETLRGDKVGGGFNAQAADAKEVGMGNPAEETYRRLNGQRIPRSIAVSTLGKEISLEKLQVS